MQVPHSNHASVRASPKELLLPLLLFVGVSGSSGTLLTWTLTASLLPAGLQAVWVLTALKSHFALFCAGYLAHVLHWVPEGSCQRIYARRRFCRVPSLNPHRATVRQIVPPSRAKVYRIWVLHHLLGEDFFLWYVWKKWDASLLLTVIFSSLKSQSFCKCFLFPYATKQHTLSYFTSAWLWSLNLHQRHVCN